MRVLHQETCRLIGFYKHISFAPVVFFDGTLDFDLGAPENSRLPTDFEIDFLLGRRLDVGLVGDGDVRRVAGVARLGVARLALGRFARRTHGRRTVLNVVLRHHLLAIHFARLHAAAARPRTLRNLDFIIDKNSQEKIVPLTTRRGAT
jgi:hypothetical protein